MEISSIILAGGKSLRLGRDKAVEEFNGESLVRRVVSSLNFLNSDIIIVTDAKKAPMGLEDSNRLRLTTDLYPAKGPLVGIYSGLMASNTRYNLVVACDMPFLNQPLLSYMTQIAEGYDVVMPRLDQQVEPLHAIYSRDCLKAIEEMFHQNKYSVNQLCEKVKVRYVEKAELDRFDPQHLSFFNINNEEKLKRAKELAHRIKDTVS